MFKPNEHTEDYHNRKPNDENFLFQLNDKEYVYVGNKVISFETKEKIVSNSSDFDFNDIKFPYANGEKSIYFMLHQKFFAIQEYKKSTQKHEYQYLHKNDDGIKAILLQLKITESFLEYGNNFIKRKIIHTRDST